MQLDLLQFLTAKWVAPSIGVLAELRIADLVADAPRTPDDLAAATGTHPQSLYRVLRAAASVGVFAEDGEGRFGLTPAAERLRSGVPGSMRAAAVLMTADPFWRPYGHLMHSVRTGEPAFDHVYGTDIYAYLAGHPELAELFGETAVSVHRRSTTEIVEAHDFGGYGTVVDVGGGTGFLLGGVLAAHPAVRGVLLERPGVLDAARKYFADEGLTDRVELVAGDFFESVPDGGDAYVVKSCLHNFLDPRATELLRAVRAVIPDHAPLVVVDAVVPPGNEPAYAKIDDIEMLAIAGGLDRREDEWAALLEAGGFTLTRVVPTAGTLSLIEATPN